MSEEMSDLEQEWLADAISNGRLLGTGVPNGPGLVSILREPKPYVYRGTGKDENPHTSSRRTGAKKISKETAAPAPAAPGMPPVVLLHPSFITVVSRFLDKWDHPDIIRAASMALTLGELMPLVDLYQTVGEYEAADRWIDAINATQEEE
jgi:hypothetical protein